MCTNWMVHWRPDIYVKWWHPRNKQAPLESEILWNQSINYESNSEYEPTKKYQWKANTTFQFKTWVFPGLNSLEEQPEAIGESFDGLDDIGGGIIKYFNFYPLNSYDKETGKPILNDEENGNTQYPVFGDLYNRENAGFFAVDMDQEFKNNGSDPKGILAGKYAVNNVESNPSSILYDEVSGVLLSGQTMIPDLTTVRRYTIEYWLFKFISEISNLARLFSNGSING